MKKIFYLLVLLTAFEAKAQEGTVFKMKFTPGRKYSSTLSMKMDLKVNMTGNDQMIEKLKSQGITLPVALTVGVNVNGDTKAGALSADNSFPLTMNYSISDLTVNIGGNSIDPLKGKSIDMRIYAHDGADGKMKEDSAFVNDKKDTSQSKMSSMLNGMQNQIKFPDHPLKVGDTFTQDAPLNMPGSGANASKTLVKSTYKLTGIADGKAYFDVTQTMDIEANVKTVNVSMTGQGGGKMVYSIADNFPVSFTDKLTMKLNVKFGTTLIDGSADISFDSGHTIN
jgi:hypothetical protein